MVNVTNYTHFNPYTNIRFEPGIHVKTPLDSWTECQYEAGILQLVD